MAALRHAGEALAWINSVLERTAFTKRVEYTKKGEGKPLKKCCRLTTSKPPGAAFRMTRAAASTDVYQLLCASVSAAAISFCALLIWPDLA